MRGEKLLGPVFDRPRPGRAIERSPQARSAPDPARPRPTVSVVVPCYNYGHFLDDCVSSLVTQEGVDVDVLIIDDTSPDGSGEVAEKIAAPHPNVSVLRHATNKGHIATYNEGLDLARGEYVVLLDADDMIAPGAFGRATALMQAHPEVGLVYGHPKMFTDTVPTTWNNDLRSWSVWQGQEWIRAQCRRGLSIIYSPEAVMRRSVQVEVGGFRPELPHAGDVDMWLRMAAVAGVGRIDGTDQAFRREHGQSMMKTQYPTILADLQGRLDAWHSFFTKDAGQLPDAAALYDTALARTAIEALDFVCNHQGADDPVRPEIPAYLDFALSTYPKARELPQWREYEWRERAGSGSVDRLRDAGYALRRDLTSKYTWRRWHRSGI